MNETVVPGIKIEIENAHQILNMGGPWVGTLLIDGYAVATDCIVDNFVFFENKNLLFFIKFDIISKYNYYFRINFYNISSKSVFEFKRKFDMVFINRFITLNELEIFKAFHNEFQSLREIFNIDNEDFNLIK